MSREDANKLLIREAIRASNEKDIERLKSLHSEDFELLEPMFPQPLARKEAMDFFADLFTAFPDQHLTPFNLLAEGDKVLIEVDNTGTWAGPFRGRKPTGRSFRVRECAVYEIKEGRIVRQRVYVDMAALAGQIGLS